MTEENYFFFCIALEERTRISECGYRKQTLTYCKKDISSDENNLKIYWALLSLLEFFPSLEMLRQHYSKKSHALYQYRQSTIQLCL